MNIIGSDKNIEMTMSRWHFLAYGLHANRLTPQNVREIRDET